MAFPDENSPKSMRLPVAEPHYKYSLSVEIEPTDIGVIRDALEDEPFAIGDLMGKPALERAIASGLLAFEAESVAELPHFERDIGTLSVYLSQYIIGREYFVRPTQGAPILRGSMIVGRMGETVRLELDVLWDARAQKIDDNGPDLAEATRRWAELPVWARDALRLEHPRLRAL
jgi:hypothetical protein